MKTLNIGTIDLPLLRSTSLVSHRGLAVPSYGEPPMSAKVALSTGVEAGTTTPGAEVLRRVAVRAVVGDVDGVQRAGARRRRYLRDDWSPWAMLMSSSRGHRVLRACRDASSGMSIETR